ncbi:MAG: hypothetical protein JWP97_4193 [Labilithrix sp.]|nr:hypothetical protein [Labilithrix sp.]
MRAAALIAALEREGFVVSRRSRTLVWMKRGGEQLMIDSESLVDDEMAEEILAQARRQAT